jgi:hypothetical protein
MTPIFVERSAFPSPFPFPPRGVIVEPRADGVAFRGEGAGDLALPIHGGQPPDPGGNSPFNFQQIDPR